MRPFRVGQRFRPRGVPTALGYRGKDKRVGADRREPVGMAVDVGELRAARLVVMKDGVHLSRHDVQPVTAEQRPGQVASIGQESGGTGGDRALPDRRRLRKDSLRVDLVAPVVEFADPPTLRGERDPVH